MAPPPVKRPSQNQAEWGPGCVSRERTQVTSPIAPAPHAGDGLERLGRVAEVLEIAAEDAGPFDGLEHALCLGRCAPQGLRAEDRLAGGGHELDGLLVEVIGHGDDDDVGFRVLDRGGHLGRMLGDAPTLAEGGSASIAARVDDAHAVTATLAMQGVGVEVADEAAAEHRDRVAVHDPSCAVGSLGAKSRTPATTVAGANEGRVGSTAVAILTVVK